MKTKHCIKCGIILTKDNANSRSGERFKPLSYCKKCERKVQQYKYNRRKCYYKRKSKHQYDVNKYFTVNMKRGNYRPFRIQFKSLEEKKSFLLNRAIQRRWGRCHSDSSSYVDKAVDEVVQYMDQDTGTFRRYCVTAKCNVPKCGGTIRYDHLGYKVCDKCGIFYSSVNINIIEHIDYEQASTDKTKEKVDHLPSYDYGMYDDLEQDDIYSTHDRFYSEAYKKTSHRDELQLTKMDKKSIETRRKKIRELYDSLNNAGGGK